MTTLVSKLHVGCVNGKPLRLYRSPIAGTQLPWHAWNDLQACMNLSEDMRAYLHRCLMTDWSWSASGTSRPMPSSARSR
ncbi:hypothetical protein [Methylobacterium sp. J-092]|uniref:hypothetical protein n=1 Tax=Methylobacterium sp. J-092 TaxID=2836667 RepID=UPI001FBB4DE4|nr:hypothetical protein [Methylobacterium sp. J-092]MCJ2010444.1 hypothetical protein [Methylobacterium sp. J-092]